MPARLITFPAGPDDEPTPVEAPVHEPIRLTVQHMRRQIRLMLVANVLALCGLGWLVWYQSVVLNQWRHQGRDITTEILQRVRAHDQVFERGTSEP